MALADVGTLIAGVAALTGVLVGPNGLLPPLAKTIREHRQPADGPGHGGAPPPQAAGNNQALAPVGLIAGMLAFGVAAVTVLYSLQGTLLANGVPMVILRVIACLIGSVAVMTSLRGFMAVRARSTGRGLSA